MAGAAIVIPSGICRGDALLAAWLWALRLVNSIGCHVVPFVESKYLLANAFALQLRLRMIPQVLQNLAQQPWKEKRNGISSLQLLFMHFLFKIEKCNHN